MYVWMDVAIYLSMYLSKEAYFQGLAHTIVGLASRKICRAGARLAIQARVDVAVLKQNFFSGKPVFALKDIN